MKRNKPKKIVMANWSEDQLHIACTSVTAIIEEALYNSISNEIDTKNAPPRFTPPPIVIYLLIMSWASGRTLARLAMTLEEALTKMPEKDVKNQFGGAATIKELVEMAHRGTEKSFELHYEELVEEAKAKKKAH